MEQLGGVSALNASYISLSPSLSLSPSASAHQVRFVKQPLVRSDLDLFHASCGQIFSLALFSFPASHSLPPSGSPFSLLCCPAQCAGLGHYALALDLDSSFISTVRHFVVSCGRIYASPATLSPPLSLSLSVCVFVCLSELWPWLISFSSFLCPPFACTVANLLTDIISYAYN